MSRSKRKNAKTVQKRLSGKYRIEYTPVSLPDAFPVAGGGGVFEQRDTPITRLHLHDCLEIGYCFSGSGIFVIEEKIFPFHAGDVSVINDQELHLAQSTRGTVSEWTWIMIDPVRLLGPRVEQAVTLSVAPLCGPKFRNILARDRHPEIASLVRELVFELREKKPGYRASVRGLMWSLMIRLHRLPGRRVGMPADSRQAEMERVAPALQHLATDYMNAISIEDLARTSGLSVTHFRRLFNKAVGKSPLEYVNHLRIQMAAALLESTDTPILQLSMDVGYETLSTFNRNFKTAMGISPREWRRRSRRGGGSDPPSRKASADKSVISGGVVGQFGPFGLGDVVHRN